MFKNRASWILSRPGARWRTVASAIPSTLPNAFIKFVRYLHNGKYCIFGTYNPTPGSTASFITMSANLQTWATQTITDYDIIDVAWNGSNYIVIGTDLSGAGEHVQRYAEVFTKLAAPTFSVPITSLNKVIWAPLVGGDYFIITTNTNYAYSADAGASFTTASYSGSFNSFTYSLEYHPGSGTYIEVRASILPFFHKFSNTIGTFFREFFSFTTTTTVNAAASIYDDSKQHFYVFNSGNILATNEGRFILYLYSAAGTSLASTSKTLGVGEFPYSFAYNAGTQTLYVLTYNLSTNTSILYSAQIAYNFPFVSILNFTQLLTFGRTAKVLSTPQGIVVVKEDGSLVVSP